MFLRLLSKLRRLLLLIFLGVRRTLAGGEGELTCLILLQLYLIEHSRGEELEEIRGYTFLLLFRISM